MGDSFSLEVCLRTAVILYENSSIGPVSASKSGIVDFEDIRLH